MTHLNTIAGLASGLLLVFLQSWWHGFPTLLGTPLNLLPALAVHAGLTDSVPGFVLVATLSSLAFDALSANTLGASYFPLLLVASTAHFSRDLVLRDQLYTQTLFGAAAGLLVPLGTLAVLFGLGQPPALNLALGLQLGVLTASNAAAAPLLFLLFRKLHRALDYQQMEPSSFRSDREIKRGRH